MRCIFLIFSLLITISADAAIQSNVITTNTDGTVRQFLNSNQIASAQSVGQTNNPVFTNFVSGGGSNNLYVITPNSNTWQFVKDVAVSNDLNTINPLTNSDTRTISFGGPVLVQATASIYGAGQDPYTTQTNKGPSVDTFGHETRWFPGTNGYYWFDKDNSTLIGSLGSRTAPFNESILRGYKSTTIGGPNQGEAIGAEVSSYFPFVGGSIAAAHDFPPHGKEIWANQLKPELFVVSSGPNQTAGQIVTNASFWGISNAIAQASALGLSQAFSNNNIGIDFWYDQGWAHTNRNANGTIGWSTNQFPGNLTLPYTVNYAHSNGWKVVLANYFSPTALPAPNTQILIDVNGVQEYIYPTNTSYGTTYVSPESTLDTLPLDVTNYYAWGIDGWVLQDEGVFVGAYGYTMEFSHRAAGACLYPIGSKLLWSQVYTNRSYALRDYIYVGAIPQPAYMYEANGMILDQVSPFVGTNGTSYGMAFFKNFQHYLASAPDRSFHPILTANSSSAVAWNTNDWQGFLGIGAMCCANLGVCQTVPAIAVNVLTNAGFDELWQDPGGKWPVTIYDGMTNGIYRRDSSDFNVKWVYFENEGLGVTNLIARWKDLGIPTNSTVSVKRVMEGDEIAVISTNALSFVIGAQSNILVKLTLVQNYLTNNYVQSITATNFTTLTASGNVGSLRIGGQLGGLATIPTITSYSGGNGQMIIYGGEDGIQFNNWQASSNIFKVSNGGIVTFQNTNGPVLTDSSGNRWYLRITAGGTLTTTAAP